LPPLRTIDEAPARRPAFTNIAKNVLVRGRVIRATSMGTAEAEVVVEGEYETGFIEHATAGRDSPPRHT
jgi:hypothetical protein